MLAALEDHVVQNPFTAVGLVKPGRFRRWTLGVVLFAISYATRHVFNRGDLAGVKTIHFARWVFLDGKRRDVLRQQLRRQPRELHGRLHRQGRVGAQRRLQQRRTATRGRSWLVFGGARDELAFKDYLRRTRCRPTSGTRRTAV